MASGVETLGPGEWVRTCREHNRICTIVEGKKPWWNERVICPAEGGHVLTFDTQWKVTRRERPAAHGWSGFNADEGQEP